MTNDTFNRNYVESKVWQFGARYIYDDDEKTTTDPYSVSIYNKYYCPQFSGNNLNNYIEIDFSVFTELYNIEALQTIKQLELFVKEGELGSWKSIKTLEQFEFVDTSNQHFDFYNDGIYSVVDPEDFVRPSDLVPQKTKNQEVVKNRTFYANNLEGYNNTCVNTELSVEYDDVESRIIPPTYNISGRIDIRAAFNSNSTFGGSVEVRNHQPIWHDVSEDNEGTETNPIVFGALSSNSSFLHDPKYQEIAIKTGQILPLGGFTVYLAGTDYHGVSKQQKFSGLSDVTQDDNGVFIGTGDDYVGHVRDYVKNEDGEFGECYSTFEIKNVPEGWYSLRVAGHGTTQSELDSGSRTYQKTSTNAYDFTNSSKSGSETFHTEVYGRNEILVHVSAGTSGDLGGIHINIMELSHVDETGGSKILTGYIVDHDNNNPVTNFEQAVADTRISRALVSFDNSAHGHSYLTFLHVPVGPLPINSRAYDYWLQDVEPKITSTVFSGEIETRTDGTITDHNGFFFFASIQANFFAPFDASGKLSVANVTSLDLPLNSYDGQKNAQVGLISDVMEDTFSIISVRSPEGNSFSNRTWVTGTVIDQDGIGILQSMVVSNRTPAHPTSSDGVYGFWHYGILNRGAMSRYNTHLNNADTALFPSQSAGTCSASFEDDQVYNFGFDYSIGWYLNGFTPTPPNSVTPTLNNSILTIEPTFFLGDSSALVTINTYKRGGDWKHALAYYDRGMRSGAVNTEKRLNLHIPFYSEKDHDGLIKVGVPKVLWKIKSTPPEWATHWQWVRTRNLTVGSYVQWAVDKVKYLNSDGSDANYSSGSRVQLFYDNMVIYNTQFPSLDFQMNINTETTRVRFIKDRDGNYFNDYYDFKVLAGGVGASVIIEKDFSMGELDEGVLVEFYNEIVDIDEDVYYEFGECFEVKESNGVKYHQGLTNDQDPLNPESNPATGEFRTGDAYYRLRHFPNNNVNNPSLIDDDAVSDFYKSEVESIGRPNVTDPDAAQLWKPNQIRHSLKYIPDSKINGFSTFYSLNFVARPIEYGDINKLKLAANVLMSIHEFRWVSNYIEEAITRTLGGDLGNLVASTDVFGGIRAAKDITGTINQESVVEYKGNIYAFDKNKGLVTRWGSDGLTIISDYKMKDYFSDKAKEILNLENKGSTPHKILGIYDSRFNEYILSFGDISKSEDTELPAELELRTLNIDINNSETIDNVLSNVLYSVKGDKESGSVIMFDESSLEEIDGIQIDNRLDSSGVLNVKVKRTSGVIEDVVRLEKGQGIQDLNISTLRYSPKSKTDDRSSRVALSNVLSKGVTVSFSEKLKKWITFYSFKPEQFGIIDLEMIAFTNGKLWIHNDSETRNNFYGDQYTSQVETIFNSLPEKVKVFQSVGAESYHPWDVPSAKTPNGMETEIVSDRFVKREDSFFASVMRDKNDPAFIGKPSDEAVINGRPLRDRTITVLFENNETEEVVLYSLSMLGTLSSRHGK